MSPLLRAFSADAEATKKQIADCVSSHGYLLNADNSAVMSGDEWNSSVLRLDVAGDDDFRRYTPDLAAYLALHPERGSELGTLLSEAGLSIPIQRLRWLRSREDAERTGIPLRRIRAFATAAAPGREAQVGLGVSAAFEVRYCHSAQEDRLQLFDFLLDRAKTAEDFDAAQLASTSVPMPTGQACQTP